MNSCINFNSKDFKNFVKSTGLEESYAGYFVSKIQNRLNLQEMPTIDILLKHYNSISDAQCQVFQKDVFETVYSLYEWNQNYGHSISEEDVDRIFENLTKLGYRGMYKYKNTDGTFGITILKPFMDNSVLNGVNFEEYHTKRNARPITVDAYQKFINNEVNHDALLGSTFNIDNTWGKLVDKYESKYDIKIKGKKTKLDKHDNRLKYKVTEVTDLRVSKFLKSINNNDLVNSDLPITYQHYNFSVESGKITLEEAIAANSVINDKSPIDKDLQNRIFNICKKLRIEYYLDPKLGKSGTSIGNKIYINPNRLNYRTILHESIHAVISYYISLPNTELSRQPKYIQKAVSNIKTLHKELWDSWISKHDEEKLNIESMPPDVLQDYLYNNGVYFLYSPNELIAELSYEGTKKFINDYSKSKKENFFSRLWETVLSFFRGESKQYHNLEKSLETLLSNYNDSLFNEIENTLEAKNLPDSNITLTEEQQKDINTISNKTAAYGVETSKNSTEFWDKINKNWQQNNPNGIVAYRKNGAKSSTFTPSTVEEGWIGNPFSVNSKGSVTVQQFYDWIVTGNNFGVDLANEDFRQAIIRKILNTPDNAPILYYTELNRPSHATVIGYLINNKHLLQQLNQQQQNNEKPEPITIPEIKPLIDNEGNFNIKESDTEESLSQKLIYTLNSRTIKPGDIIDVTSVKDPNLMIKLIKFLKKQTNHYIFEYDDGPESFNKLPEEWQHTLKENNINIIPKFSYLFTRQEIKIREEEDNIINSELLKPSDLLEYSKTAALQFSKALQALKTIPEANEYYFGDKYKDYSFIGNTTEEILNKVGLAYALDEIIKEGIFNPDNNDAVLDNNTLVDKLSLIYDNFRGFVNLSYDQFLNIEGISIEDTSYGYAIENANVENRQSLESEEDVDSIAIAEEQGSVLEHWQIGFRSVSVHQSMSQQLRSYLNTLLDLDENGLAKYNELGFPKTINPVSVVDTILRLTQGSESLNKKDSNGKYEKTSMVYKLRQYTKTYPYLKQLVDNYYPDGDPANTPIEGLLISGSPQVEQLQSLFYTSIQRNHQLYNILFNDNGNTRLKSINKDTYTQKLIDTLSDSLNNKEIGMLNSYDFKNKKWKTEKAKELKNSISTLAQNLSKNPYVDNKVYVPLQNALSFLNIEIQNTDILQSLIANTPISQLQKKVIDPIWYILKDISDNGDDISYNLLNNKNRSNYKLLSAWLSPIMVTEMQSMFYQDGKSYYSFVLPSYINKTVKKLKGETANWDDYMKRNYGNIGWFRTKDGGYLNYWLELIENNDKIRDNLEHSVLLSDYGVGYGDKTAAEYMSSIIASYFYNDNSDYALFRVGLLSNKPSEEYLKFQKITKNYEKEIVDKLFQYTFTQEVNRILAVKERKKAAIRGDELKKKFDSNTITDEELSEWDKTNRFTSNNLVSNLDSNGDKFHFLDFLNDDIENNTELGEKLKKYLNGDSSIEDMSDLPELLKDRIKNAIEKEYNVFKKACVDNLVFTVDENGNYKTTDVATLKNLNLKDNTKLNEERLKEFFYNDYFAQVNMTQLFITDLALYKNTEDLQKRLAQLHAPSMKPNTEATINGEKVSDGKFRTVYIKDSIIEPKSVTNGLKLAVQNILKQLEDDGVSKNSIKYKQLKARLNNIVDAFSEVNWADAQGYTSPTAYRKRMAMFGKWSEREERAYKQLKEKGKISIEDLDILWQPLKPFGYSQVSIDGHNSYIPQFKIGIQNKNSEYLLIMADALLKGGKQNSKLSAIMDIMEESYDLDSTKGIDTIQFESTVKVGKRSVIDINNLKTAIDVKKALKEALYINGRYNPEYVNEYDFEDYGIQQEVPAHFEGKQQQGSQVRILSISDIACVDKNGKDKYITVDGETMTIREAKQNYMKAIADNINTSMEELARIFKLGHSKIEKNKALSDLIREEIMRDSKYSPDLLWACSLNNAGEFNIPLSDPIHSVQIQQLLNSIIKNRIWKQKIAGGPVVQVSSFGLSEDLQVEYNEDGTVKCFQAYVPIYDENLIRDFMNDEGEVDIEKIKNSNPKLLEMMGYRIPTESKYSMVPIKVVGFLPRNAGEGIMLPAEITTLSGSDFDIDKLYIMRYEWDRDIDNEEVGILKKMIESEFDEKINSSDIREYFLGNENVIQNLNIKKLLDTFRYKAVKYNEPRNKRASNNNKIIDYSLAFLTSQYTLEQFITPGNFDSVKKIGYKIAAVKNNNDVEYNDLNDKTADEIKEKAYTKQSLLYAHTQMSFYKQNSVAAKLIGAFAQANVSHAYVNTHCDLTKQPAQIFIGIKDRDGNVVSGSGFTINGYSFEGWQSLDPEYEMALGNEYATTPYLYNGDNRVSSYLASLLAASVDAVKDPVLNLMNINMDTVNVLVTLLRLGVDLETSALFLSHPAVVDLTKKGGFKDGGFILDDRLSNLSKFNTNSFTVNKEFLKEELSRSKENANISDIKNRDYVVLSTLQKIINVGKDVMKVTSATRYNSISSGVGPYATDTIVQEIKTYDFSSNGNLSDGITNILRANNEKGNPILGSIYESAYSTVYGVFGSNNFLQSSLSMFSALKKLKDVLGYLNTDVAKKFADYYVSINQIADPEHSTINPSDENRDYMLNDFPLIFKDLKADYLKSYNNNLLLESIMTDTDNLGNPILTLKTRGLSNDRIKELKNSWYELWKNDKDLAFALIEYNFFRGGFTYSPKTFMHLLSDNIKLELPNYIYNLKNSVFNLEMPDNIIDQFLILYDLINKKANTEEELKDRQQSLAGDSYEIVKFGNDYVKITNSTIIPLPNLGGHNQAFEADPSKAVTDMKSVIRKREQPLLHNEIEEVPDNSRSHKPPIDYIAKLLGEDYDKDSEVVLSKLKSTVSKASIQTMLIKAGMNGTQIEELQDRLTFALTNAKDLNIEQIQNIFNDFSNILTNLNMCN